MMILWVMLVPVQTLQKFSWREENLQVAPYLTPADLLVVVVSVEVLLVEAMAPQALEVVPSSYLTPEGV